MKKIDLFKNLALIAGICVLFTACNQENKQEPKDENTEEAPAAPENQTNTRTNPNNK